MLGCGAPPDDSETENTAAAEQEAAAERQIYAVTCENGGDRYKCPKFDPNKRRVNPNPPSPCVPDDGGINRQICLHAQDAWEYACKADCTVGTIGVGWITGTCSKACESLANKFRDGCVQGRTCP
jgi:hypothetical protein